MKPNLHNFTIHGCRHPKNVLLCLHRDFTDIRGGASNIRLSLCMFCSFNPHNMEILWTIFLGKHAGSNDSINIKIAGLATKLHFLIEISPTQNGAVSGSIFSVGFNSKTCGDLRIYIYCRCKQTCLLIMSC